jgi:anaerobic magnesium-protoporphyrin IX monomethyl ester cyclase
MKIDCLFIGHNEMQFESYEKSVRSLGKETEAYADLALNFIELNGKLYPFIDLMNHICADTRYTAGGDISLDDVFSPTIAYLGSYLDRHGLAFDYIHSFQKQKKELQTKLENNRVVAVGIITTLYVSLTPIVEIVRFIRGISRTVKIIVGGPFVNTQARSRDALAFNQILTGIGADYYINESQGEESLVTLLEYLNEKLDFSQVKNVYYRRDKTYLATQIAKENNLLENNRIRWELFSRDIKKTIGVRTAISCPFNCSFCGFPERAGEYRTESVAQVAADFAEISKLKNITGVNIIDDTFNIPLERFKAILKAKIDNDYHFKWNSYLRCQYLDEEAVDLMQKSGCEGVFLGIESANQQILDNMNKKVRVSDYQKGMEMLKKYRIMTFASFIFGFPGENEDSIEDTIDFIKTWQPDFYRIQLWYCEKITPIWQAKDKYNIRGNGFSWSHHTMDSKTALYHLYEAFVNIDNSIWLPQYNFDFVGIFNLLRRGFSMVQVRELLSLFDGMIKHKILAGDRPPDNNEYIAKMKNVL